MVDHHDLVTPEETEGVDRRSFVKACVGVAAAGSIAATGFGLFKPLAIVKPTTSKMVRYLGAKVLAGSPAPRGVPLIPLRVNAEGFIEGVPEHLDWYRYCSHEEAPGLADAGFTKDNVFRYFLTEEKLIKAGPQAKEIWWYADRLEQKVHVDHFKNLQPGTGAAVRWRSEGVSGSDVVTAIVIKLDPSKFTGDAYKEFMTTDGSNLVGYSSFCPHFCCVPGFKEDQVADKFDAWDMIFCTCHNSRYDPTDLVEYEFELKLGEDSGDNGGGH